jgi:predicted nucleotidyltransferase
VPELDIEGILRALVRGEVEFLLIGGVAVGFHGYVRATKEVDIVPSPDAENLTRLAGVMRELGAEIAGGDEFADDELPDPLDPAALALGGNWVLSTRLGRFDVMQWIGDEALWEKLSPAATSAQIGDLKLRVVGYEDLVALKRRAGRPEDLADLRRLSEARGESPGRDSNS